jgi:hypothetical protein
LLVSAARVAALLVGANWGASQAAAGILRLFLDLVAVLTLEARWGGRALVSNQAVLVKAGGTLVEEKRTRAGMQL